ncbi:FHA domain-containing protein [Candidatus Poribacteria bacterium]|nr:FHA domain-containing protein [Candidatus Poribacteria bacterium]
MKKAFVFGLLMLIIGFVLWRMIAGGFFDPSRKVVAGVSKENFSWFTCANCGKLFMAEATTRKGNCPYCGFQMMLVTEDKKVMGAGADDSDFVWFFSPACKKLFFAYQTHELGKCPYCGESIDLTAPATIDLQQPPPRLISMLRANMGKLFLGVMGVLAASIAGIYIFLENRVIMSLEPIQGARSGKERIDLSKRLIKRKRLTLGASTNDDIVIRDPSLKGAQCSFSFVHVGGKTHAYLHGKSNQPISVNDKLQYNPQLKNHDKVRIGDIVFEVHAHEK